MEFFDADEGYNKPPTGGSSIVYNSYDVGVALTVEGRTLSANYDYNENSSNTAVSKKTMVIYKEGSNTKVAYM